MASTDDIVGFVLAAAHPKLRERCNREQIVAVLEDQGAYDCDGIRDLLMTRFDATLVILEGAAPTAFLSSLLRNVVNDPAIGPASEPASGTAVAGSGSSAAASSADDSVPSASSASATKQVSLGSLIGSGTVRKFERLPSGTRILSSSDNMSAAQLAAMPAFNAGYCAKGCGRFAFANAGARATHEKSCRGLVLGGAGAAAAANSTASEIGHAEVAASTAAAAASSDVGEPGDLDDAVHPPAAGKEPKLRKTDNKPKQSGNVQGESSGITHTLYFRLEVVKTLRHYQRLVKLGRCPEGAGRATSAFYNGLSESNITRWGKQEEQLREELAHEKRVDRPQSKQTGKLPTSFSSKGARRMSLHRGRTVPFAACEVELHAKYRLRRRGDGDKHKGGQRVTGHWLRIQMKRLVRLHYGDHAAGCFKASKFWLRNFSRRFGISLRRKSNSKAEPIEVRLPKIQRWHTPASVVGSSVAQQRSSTPNGVAGCPRTAWRAIRSPSLSPSLSPSPL